jgi:diguanylate cyclase (GGDEF)-like protein
MSHLTRNPPLLETIGYIFLFLLLYILFPIYTAGGLRQYQHRILFLFYLTNIINVFYLLKKYSQQKYNLDTRIQDFQEKINVLNAQTSQESKNNAGLKVKIMRYNNLKDIIEELNRSLNIDSVAESLTSIAFSTIANSKGVCILYLIDKQLNLQIFKTRKEDKNLVIKAKEGDIFDFWVLRHASPLLIEDARKDFRFDLEKLKNKDGRAVLSVISTPLLSEHRFLGTLRLDNSQANFYSQDDLRFLVSICDLGAAALENSELFQRIQDLAIHDSLTSLYTKGYFLQRLKEECKRGMRYGKMFSLLMLDIDFFKNYNDKFGHTAGDIVLKKLSQTMTESLKGSKPIIGRVGGEEFCIILLRIDKKKACTIADELCRKIEKEKINLRRQDTGVTVSIGVVTSPGDATEEDELIKKADRAMYEAKQKGRNRVCCI